jgi:Protein of unknown function (DUF2384)
MATQTYPITTTGDPDETRDIESLIREVVPDPDAWMATVNPNLGGHTPASLIGQPNEPILRDLLRRVKHGYTS